jgi:hypothetical protein
VIYLYAIIETPSEVPACAGFDDAPLRAVESANVAALYSEHQALEPRTEAEMLWRHEQVVEAAMEQGPALPVRFGTTFADVEALCLVLEREGDRLGRQLRRVTGCVELAVRVGMPERRERPSNDGRSYVEAGLARRKRHQTIVQRVLAPLAELAVGVRGREEGGVEGNVIRASYLVPTDSVARFADEVRLLSDRTPDVWLSCTGPWPPYSFVGLEDAA